MMAFRLQMPIPANPAPSSIKDAGSGVLVGGIACDNRLPWPSPASAPLNRTFRCGPVVPSSESTRFKLNVPDVFEIVNEKSLVNVKSGFGDFWKQTKFPDPLHPLLLRPPATVVQVGIERPDAVPKLLMAKELRWSIPVQSPFALSALVTWRTRFPLPLMLRSKVTF